MRILQYDPEGTAQVRLLDLVHIDAVISDLSVLNIIKTIDQIHDRGFTGARCTDKRNLLSGLRIQLDIMQDDLVVTVAEVNLIKYDISLQLHIGRRIRILVIMLPCPDAGPFLTFMQRPVRILFRIDKLHITVVHLGLLVHQLKETVCTRKRHDD